MDVGKDTLVVNAISEIHLKPYCKSINTLSYTCRYLLLMTYVNSDDMRDAYAAVVLLSSGKRARL